MQEKCVFLCVFVYFLAMVDRRKTKEAPSGGEASGLDLTS